MTKRTAEQQAAFEKLGRLKVGALFMEMGTGKTKTALDLIDSKKEKIDYALWICPCALKSEIEAERKKWHPEMELDVVGCESIGSSERIYLNTRSKMEGKRCFVVVDESLKIKNIRAKRTRRIIDLGKLAEYKLILNGTPLSRNIMDMWAQMEFLSPKILGMTYRQFKDCYTEYWTEGKLAGVIKNQVNVEHLISKISPYIFDASLEIDARKSYYNAYYHMGLFEEEAYEQIKQDAYDKWLENQEEDMDMYGLFARLQAHYTQAEDKTKKLNELIDKIDGKVLVFVKYLASIPKDALKITGDMKTEERAREIRYFRDGEEKVMYITYGCGAFGLNLQFVHNVVFAEHIWDYAARIQAEARVYRIGQEEDVNYWDLRCDCGLEEMILKNLWKKENLLDEVKKEIETNGVKGCLNAL